MNDFEKALEKYFGSGNLAKIQKVSVGIAGCGGLGSNCAFNLARSGFRKLTLCDFDVIEHSNLNRQFYFLDQVGRPKVEALRENLLRINPALEITVLRLRLSAENIRDVFKGCDAVVEAFDRADCKKMIAEAFMRSDTFFVSASGLAGWGNSDEITVRKVHGSFHLIGDLKSEAAPGRPPCSPRVNIAAAKQADVILNWAINK